MGKDSFKFPDNEEEASKKALSAIPVDQILSDSRRVDDALLHALSLVLSSNSEYARSVSALLENDLSREQIVDHLNNSSKELLENTRMLIKSQEQLRELLTDSSKEYKEFLDTAIKGYLNSQQDYMDKKFRALFENVGLKDDGSSYGPTDKFILKIRNLFTDSIFAMVIGAGIYQLALTVIRYFKG